MLNGLKDMFRSDSDKTKKEDNGNSKRTIVVLVCIALVSIIGTIIQYFNGSDDDRAAMLTFIRNNFHINPIDLSIMIILAVVLIVIRIKKKGD